MGDGDELGLGLEGFDDLLVAGVRIALTKWLATASVTYVGTPPSSARTAVVLTP